jgi:AcrR family transcriptional regulator
MKSVPSTSTTRETLLDAALRLLEERGPGALRIRDLAAATEKSTMGVYTHFGSKQGLLEQLYLHGFRRLEDRLNSVPSDGQGRLAGLSTFEMLATRVADWRPDFTDPAADAHLVWATMHGLVSIELMHRRWGGPLVAHLQGDPEQNYATAIGSLLEALHGR